MLNCIKDYKVSYSELHDGDIDAVEYIFTDALQMIGKADKRKFRKLLRSNHAAADCLALNILQNLSMTEIVPVTATEFIMESQAVNPYNLYDAINHEKFNRGCISKEQFEDNKHLGVKIRLASPLWTLLHLQ